MATVSSTTIECDGPNQPMATFRAVVCNGRWPDESTFPAGLGRLFTVRD